MIQVEMTSSENVVNSFTTKLGKYCGFNIGTWMSYKTQEMSEIRVSSKIDRSAFTETLS